MPRTILVTGYTGRLGSLVARALRDEFQETPRVLVRPAHVERSDWAAPSGMEVIVGDLDEPATLSAALDGVDAVFLVSPVHPQLVQRETGLVTQAAQLPSKPHIVKIAGLGTRIDSFVDSGRWHAEVEQAITGLELPATFLRPLFFMQNLGFQINSMREHGVLRGGIGDAAIAMADARDIADVAAALLMQPDLVPEQAIELTGKQSLTYEQVAQIASNAFGKPITYERQSLAEVEQALLDSGQPQWHAQILLQFNRAFQQGWGEQVSHTVEHVLQRPPRTLDAYLQELASSTGAVGTNPFPS